MARSATALPAPTNIGTSLGNYTSPYFTFTTLAGQPGFPGNTNGFGTAAKFWHCSGIATDGNGNTYVADQFNDTIREITPDGYVTTLAGSPGVPGSVDGVGPDARFDGPTALTMSAAGNIYVADAGSGSIRLITIAGGVATVSTLSVCSGPLIDGQYYEPFYFSHPVGVAADPFGDVFVIENGSPGNYEVYEISQNLNNYAVPLGGFYLPSGQGFNPPSLPYIVEGIAGYFNYQNEQEYIYYTDGTGEVFEVIPSLYRAPNGAFINISQPTGVASNLPGPEGLTVDDSGNIFVSNLDGTIDEINSSGTTHFAGVSNSPGSADGSDLSATFWNPTSLALDPNGDLYVADQTNSNIREVSTSGIVSTLAGSAGNVGSNDGPIVSIAQFYDPTGVAVDSSGNSYVADGYVREVTPAGVVSNFGNTDDAGGLAIDPASGNLYVSNSQYNSIDKITPAGVETLFAGIPFTSGAANNPVGTQATFNEPLGLAVDAGGNVYVADTQNDVIRKITPGGAVSTLAGTPGTSGSTNSPPLFNHPRGVAVDTSGNVFVADSDNQTIREISNGVVTTLAGSALATGTTDGPVSSARFNEPYGITVDANDNLFVADTNNNAIREISHGNVTTVGGVDGTTGFADSEGPKATFNGPWGIAVDANGQLYVADTNNETLRKGYPDIPVESTEIQFTVTASMVGERVALDFLNFGNFEFPYCSIASGPATLSDNVLTFTGAGTVVVSINNTTGNPPAVPTQPPQPPPTLPDANSQTINFLPSIDYNEPYADTVTLDAVATSNLPVTYSVVSGPATLSGIQNNILTFTAGGWVTLQATQAGSDAFLSAESFQSFFVDGPSQLTFTNEAGSTFVFGTANTFTVTTSGPSAPTSLSVIGTLPNGLTFKDNGDGTGTLSGTPPLGSIGNYLLEFQATSASQTASQEFKLTVGTAFDAWANANGAVGGPAGTPQNDGVPNLLKYFYGINPSQPMTAADNAAFPVVGLTKISGVNYLTLTYRQNPSAIGLTVTVQTCSDLQSWTTATGATVGPTGATDPATGYSIMQARVPVTPPQQFLRLNVAGS